MLRIFRPRHIMWKYWMFQPEKPMWRGGDYVWGFFARGYREKRREWINFRICGLNYDHNEAVSRKKNRYSCSRETITRWKQWIKILQQQKNVRNWIGGRINWTKKTLQFFMLHRCMTRIIVIYFCNMNI